MVSMVVCDEYTHDIGIIQSHLTQILLNSACRDASINEDTPGRGTQEVTVAATAAGKTSEYELVICHFFFFLLHTST
jgi:hypothetical protein